MHTKGSAFLARRQLVVAKIGQETWDEFLARFAEREAIFAQPILPTTKIAMQPFLDLNDAIVAEFYEGDPRAHWEFGEASADWAFSQGPYQKYFDTRSFKRFIDSMPMLWRAYYDAGEVEAIWYDKEQYADLTIRELPILHIHFEYNVMGYARRGLELTGGVIKLMRPLAGIESGDDEIHYQFYVEARPVDDAALISGEHEIPEID